MVTIKIRTGDIVHELEVQEDESIESIAQRANEILDKYNLDIKALPLPKEDKKF